MGCSGCTSGLPAGCRNNGSCGTNGCDKLTVFDWLSDMELPDSRKAFDCMEVRFKNGRKEFFRNVNDIAIHIGDAVAVEGSPGHDVGTVTLTGELVRLQMKNKSIDPESKDLKKLYRKANQRDLNTSQEAQKKEYDTMLRARIIAKDLGLVMKISDVEYQGDGTKATFYYTADDRVDFREFIKLLASEFRIRIEMRQIGARQEAGRLGGIGSCGRELCCSTWLTDFRSVNTSAARYQQLALNPQKLAGQCGKLKCCLNYELDSYLDALRDFPKNYNRLKTKKGDAFFQKMDIFRRKLWYSYAEGGLEWIALDASKVKEILADNEKNIFPEALEEFKEATVNVTSEVYSDVVGEDSLTRFDHKKGSKRKKRNPRRNRGRNKNAR